MNEPREVTRFTTSELAYMQESTQRKVAALESERDRALNLFAELRRDYADYDCDDPECGGRCIWCRYRALAEPTKRLTSQELIAQGGTPEVQAAISTHGKRGPYKDCDCGSCVSEPTPEGGTP